MTTNKMRPIHPGEILREEFLIPLGMSAHALSIALHVPAPRVHDIARERRAVTPDTALRLARYFDTTAQFWLNLQSAFDLKQAEQDVGRLIKQEIRPRVQQAAYCLAAAWLKTHRTQTQWLSSRCNVAASDIGISIICCR
jgi:addiction module HigA family antidote